MKKSEFRSLIREEIRKVLAEIQLDPVNQKLKDKYIDAYLTLTIDPYAGEYDSGLPSEDKIEAHAKKYGYEKTLATIAKHPDVTALRYKYARGVQDDPLASKAPGTPVGNLAMRDPMKHMTKGGKMDKRDVERLKMKIKQNLGIDF
jgi:hypothetical protein